MGALKDVFWDSPKAQIDTLFKRDLKKADAKAADPFRNISDGGKGMTAQARKDFLARKAAKESQGSDMLGVQSPLSSTYS